MSKILNPWMQLKRLNYEGSEKNLEIWHLAQISKIMGMHRSVDKYGALPYFNVGNGNLAVAYDSAEDIYKSFFTELKEAADYLYAFGQSTPVITRASDVIYEGDAIKWAKLANSLMLRLAMRVRYVDPALSKQWAETAMSHPAGLISAVNEVAKLERGAGITTKNALFTIAGSYGDTRMGASIYSYLNGYQDPRLSVYFEGNTRKAVPPAIPSTGSTYANAARPRVTEFSPTYWMKASEVAFLQAEAALYGYSAGASAQAHYERGVRLSFEENSIAASRADSYLQSTRTPAAFTDSDRPEYSAVPPSTVTPAWDASLPDEQKLEKIVTQKYLAIFPDGQEAWSEWRRTGYPRLIPANTNISNAGVVTSDGYKDGVRSWPYPQSEFTNNNANVTAAIARYRGGRNDANINVWWDAKVKN